MTRSKTMNFNNIYTYEIELKNGTIVTNHNKFNPKDVVRISYISKIFPRYDIIFVGFSFVKRFRRVFMRIDNVMRDIIHCVITNKFRLYIRASNGSILITDKDYELYL